MIYFPLLVNKGFVFFLCGSLCNSVVLRVILHFNVLVFLHRETQRYTEEHRGCFVRFLASLL